MPAGSFGTVWLLTLESSYGFLLRGEYVEDPMHPHEFEGGSNLLGHATQFEIATLGSQLAQAGQHGAHSPELSTNLR